GGECWACLGGTSGCPNRYRTRNTLTADDPPHFLGAFAEYYLLKATQWVFKVPDGLPDELVAPVNCALSQVVYGLQQIGVWLGDTVVVQVAGIAGIVQEGLEMTRVGGRYLWMGNIVPGVAAEIVPHDAVRQPKTIRGVLAYDRWVIPRALDWVSRTRGKYPFATLVGARFPLEQINDAFEQAEWAAGKGSVARTVIVP